MRLLDSDSLPTQRIQFHDFPFGTDGASVSVLPDHITVLPDHITVIGTTGFVNPLQMAAEDYDGDFDFDLDLEDDDEADDDEEDDDDDDDDEFPSEEEDDD